MRSLLEVIKKLDLIDWSIITKFRSRNYEIDMEYAAETDTKYYLEYYEESEVEVDGVIYQGVLKFGFLSDLASFYIKCPCGYSYEFYYPSCR